MLNTNFVVISFGYFGNLIALTVRIARQEDGVVFIGFYGCGNTFKFLIIVKIIVEVELGVNYCGQQEEQRY